MGIHIMGCACLLGVCSGCKAGELGEPDGQLGCCRCRCISV